MRAPEKQIRLFCFPYSGASSSLYVPWSKELPDHVELHPVELPGRGSRAREAAHIRIGPLVRTLARDLLPFLERPFAFFGHSLGALIGYELARFLRTEYIIHPVHLFVSARGAPQCRGRHRPMHGLPEPDLLDQLRTLGGTSETVLGNSELMRLLIPVIRADFAVCETYTYVSGLPLDCPISAFGGAGDLTTSLEEIAGWKEHTRGRFICRELPGDHFFLKTEQQALLEAIAHDLAMPHPALSRGLLV